MSHDTIESRLQEDRVQMTIELRKKSASVHPRFPRYSFPLTAGVTKEEASVTPVSWAPSEILNLNKEDEVIFSDELENRIFHFNSENIKEKSLLGMIDIYPKLRVDLKSSCIYLPTFRHHKVALLAGGSCGHEPFGSGFVGENMLTCWVSGPVFSPPTWQQILSSIVITASLNMGGVLVLFPNFPVDQLKFGIAIEEAKAHGITVEGLAISDDISLWDRKKRVMNLPARRRWRGRVRRPLRKGAVVPATDLPSNLFRPCGVGALFIFKIVGAQSRMGFKLADLVVTGRDVHERTCTMGACLSSPSLPNGGPIFTFQEEEISLGVNIRSQPGFMQKIELVECIEFILNKISSKIIQFNNLNERSHLKADDRDKICVIVNNMGTLTTMELYLLADEVHRILEESLFYNVVRLYVGTFCTSLDMNGFQVSVLNITLRDEWMWLLDSETEAGSWTASRLTYNKKHVTKFPLAITFELPCQQEVKLPTDSIYLGTMGAGMLKTALASISSSLIAYEEYLNQMDSQCGDGDAGYHLAAFGREIEARLHVMPVWRVGRVLILLSRMAEKKMGGAISVFYSRVFFGAAMRSWSWLAICDGMMRELVKLTSARIGYRSMIDAMVPACQAFQKYMKKSNDPLYSLKKALERASQGCEATRNMPAKVGRAASVHPSVISGVDPGALGVVIWLSAIFNAINTPTIRRLTKKNASRYSVY